MGMNVGELTARMEYDGKDFDAGIKSAEKSMGNIKKAADAATKQIENDFKGVSKELKTMFNDVDTDKLTRELKQGGQAAEQAARKIESALKGIDDDTERARKGVALFGAEWKDAGRKAERSLQGVEDKLKGVEKEAKGLDLGALGGAAAIGGGLALADNKAAAEGHLAAMLGITKSEAAELNKIAADVWKGNYGTDRRDAAEGVALVHQALGSTGSKLKTDTETAFALRDVYGADIAETMNAIAPMKINFQMSDQGAFDTITKGMQMGLNRSNDFIDTLNEYPAAFTRVGFGSDRMLASLEGGFKAGLKDTDKLADSINEFGLTMLETDGKIATAFVETGVFSESEMERLRNDFAKGGEAGEAAFDKVLTAIMNTEDPVKRNFLGVQAFGTMWEDTSGLIGVALMDTKDKSIDVEGATESLGLEYDNFASKAEALGRTLQDSVIGRLGDIAGGAMPAIEAIGNLGMGVLALKGLGLDLGGVLGRLSKITLPTLAFEVSATGLAFMTAAGYVGMFAAAIYGAIEWDKRFAPELADLRGLLDPMATVADQYTGSLSTEANADVGDLQRQRWGYEVPEDAPTAPTVKDMSWLEQKLNWFDTGGIVPGPLGSPQLAVVHGGEEVLTAAQRKGGGSTVHHTFDDITVRGVNNKGELVATTRLLADDFRRMAARPRLGVV